MEDTSTIVILLTITVIMLSVVIVVLLGIVTVLMFRLNKIAKNIEAVSTNIAEATSWFTPAKLISTVVGVFRR